MDCRTIAWLAAVLLAGAAGCKQQQTVAEATRNFQPLAGKDLPPDPRLVKKEPARPMRQPRPEVLVKLADFQAGEATAPWLTPAQRDQKREDARISYQQAISIDPKCVAAYQGLARLYTDAQDHAHAVETYRKGLQAAPKNAALWHELGLCHNYQKEWGPALECLNQAARLDPANREIINTLGVVLARTGHYQESLECFSRVSGEALAHYKLARTLQHLQQPELARQHLELALQKDPSLASAQAMRGEMNGPTAPTTPAVQRTAYEEAPAPPGPMPPPAAPVAPAVFEAPAAGGEVLPEIPAPLPPAPVLNLEYESLPPPVPQAPEAEAAAPQANPGTP